MEGIDTEIFNNEQRLIISFGGIANKPGMPIFEFKKLFNDVKINKIFVVDKNMLWYYLGINNEIKSHNDLLIQLSEFIKQYGKKYTMFYGNSMGGFGAIKFGIALNVNRIVAFSPQTFLSKELRNKYNDNRWSSNINTLINKFDSSILDLKSFIPEHNKTKCDIYYCKNDYIDSIHAERLSKYNNFNLYKYIFGNHGLVMDLKKKNILKDILLKDLKD